MSTESTLTPAEIYVAGMNQLEAEVRPEGCYIFSASKPGPKYTRITHSLLHPGSQILVHAFVENSTGYVFKAAGWAAPAKGIRYISVEDALTAARADGYHAAFGGYLYAGRN